MFGIRTPAKRADDSTKTPEKEKESMDTALNPSLSREERSSRVRKSIENIEAACSSSIGLSMSPPKNTPTSPAAAPATKTRVKTIVRKQSVEMVETKSPPARTVYPTRVAEGRSCLNKAKLHLSNSKNLKTEIKEGVASAVDRLYQIIKEQDTEIKKLREQVGAGGGGPLHPIPSPGPAPSQEVNEEREGRKELTERVKQNTKLLEEHIRKMEALSKALEETNTEVRAVTYASVAAGKPAPQAESAATVHSVVVTSRDQGKSGDEIIENIRKVIKASEGGVRIDRIRKARDRKVIIGCTDKEEIGKIKERIGKAEKSLKVEEIKNKDPLVILYGVLKVNKDEDIIKAIHSQNGNIVQDLKKEEKEMEVKYRKRARNPLTDHVVLRVSPALWKRLTAKGSVYVDLQRVAVADQSPLVQCSKCLGYGHSRKICHEEQEVCSHCGGPHLKAQCGDYLSQTPPCCRNCSRAGLEQTTHNAFDSCCPVRRKWETIARSAVAYC